LVVDRPRHVVCSGIRHASGHAPIWRGSYRCRQRIAVVACGIRGFSRVNVANGRDFADTHSVAIIKTITQPFSEPDTIASTGAASGTYADHLPECAANGRAESDCHAVG